MSRVSLWNSTDHTFHVELADERAIRVIASRVATSAFWLGILTTLVIALVLLSTSQQRKGPIFILQCLAFVMAISYNVLVYIRAVWRHRSTFRMPDEPYDPGRENRAQTTVLLMEHWIPLISDTAVIFKVMGFYPAQLYTLRSKLLRLIPPALLLLVRAGLICYLTYVANIIYTEASSLSGQVQQVFSLNLVDVFVYIGTAIFATEAAFCLYASCFLVYKICQFYLNLKQQDVRIIRRKSRFFVEITCMTFIPPLVLSIACAALLYQSDNGPSKYREVVAVLANISVVFSLLATSWSTIRSRHSIEGEDQDLKEQDISLVSKLCYGTQQTRQSQVTNEHSTPFLIKLYNSDEAASSGNQFKTYPDDVIESASSSAIPLVDMLTASSTTRAERPLSSNINTKGIAE